MARADLTVNRGCVGGGGRTMPAERTTDLWSGAKAASNPECREEGRGGCCGGFKPL